MMRNFILLFSILGIGNIYAQKTSDSIDIFRINDLEYLERRGANVMLAHDFYPESHQGGVGIIQNGIRVATNGDLRLEPAPGQWQPVPKVGERHIDREKQEISVHMSYPDPSKDRQGFNPIIYPELEMSYELKVIPQGKSFKIIVDLDKPLPEEWVGKVGMNIEFFPGILFGKSFYMDDDFGIFNRQANGPGYYTDEEEFRLKPMARGNKLVIAPGTPKQSISIENLGENSLKLLDGRAIHSNGWFIVRSLVPAEKTKNAIEWLVTPNTLKDFLYSPVVQVSQTKRRTRMPGLGKPGVGGDDRLHVFRRLCCLSRFFGISIFETGVIGLCKPRDRPNENHHGKARRQPGSGLENAQFHVVTSTLTVLTI